MSSATTQSQALPEELDLYRVRDDIARQYGPVTPLEVMLVTQIAQAWICLQFAYETRRRYFQANDVLDAIANQFEQYKAVTREVTNCERVWRHATLQLEKLQRQRRKNGLGFSERRREPRSSPDFEPPGPSPVSSPADTPVGSPPSPAKPQPEGGTSPDLAYDSTPRTGRDRQRTHRLHGLRGRVTACKRLQPQSNL